MNEWDMDLWVHFTRTGSLSELEEQDPNYIGDDIQAYLERDGLEYSSPSWHIQEMVWVARHGYEDEAMKSDWTGSYIRVMQVVQVDVWDLKYHFVERSHRRGTRLGDHLTEIEGFVNMHGIVGAPTREEAYALCHSFINLNCSMCGTMKWEIMR